MRKEMELRNVPRNRVMEYLQEAGGTPDGELSVSGEGWHARLEEMEPAQVITMTIRRDCLIIEGGDDIVPDVYAYLRRKTMRGGG